MASTANSGRKRYNMTNREFLTAIANMENISEELKAEATARIEKLDATNEARKNKPSKKATENAPIMEQIVNEILTSEAQTASAIAETAGISVQKASALLRQLVADGKATVTEVKIPKKGVQKAYAAVDAE
jgi:predicted transcriptional regulator